MRSHELAEHAWIDREIFDTYPLYQAGLVAISDLSPGESSAHSETMLADAEMWGANLVSEADIADIEVVRRWREIYAGFGVKPREARSSVEALLRRTPQGLPRIDRLTDVYNAVSVRLLTPLGGEDAQGYEGVPRLVVADGSETFESYVDGELVSVAVPAGEIVWRDDLGVTCRRWNWRQCVRTRLNEATTDALFIVDGWGTRQEVEATINALVESLRVDSPSAHVSSRVIGAT